MHPDFPKKGIVFLDLFPILRDPVAFESLITTFLHHCFSVVIPKTPSKKIDVVVGLDARYNALLPVEGEGAFADGCLVLGDAVDSFWARSSL